MGGLRRWGVVVYGLVGLAVVVVLVAVGDALGLLPPDVVSDLLDAVLATLAVLMVGAAYYTLRLRGR
jgi:hypothetical protein